jgi:hypothetical protein
MVETLSVMEPNFDVPVWCVRVLTTNKNRKERKGDEEQGTGANHTMKWRSDPGQCHAMANPRPHDPEP